MNLDGFTIVLGVLGAYFAILLVLSVSVETLLEPFTWFRGLRKQASPDEVLASVQEWLPDGSEEAKKVVAIQTFASQTKTNMQEIDNTRKWIATKCGRDYTVLDADADGGTGQFGAKGYCLETCDPAAETCQRRKESHHHPACCLGVDRRSYRVRHADQHV
jgi:hypothetical protein